MSEGTLERMTTMYKRSVAAHIRTQKGLKKLSSADIAVHCGVTVDTVNSWLSRGVIPGSGNLAKLDKLLNND